MLEGEIAWAQTYVKRIGSWYGDSEHFGKAGGSSVEMR